MDLIAVDVAVAGAAAGGQLADQLSVEVLELAESFDLIPSVGRALFARSNHEPDD